MMDKIMDLVKGQVSKFVSGSSEIPEDKKEQTVEVATGSLVDGLKKYATADNLSSLTSMFGGGATKATGPDGGGMMQKLEKTVESALVSKVGLSSSVAQMLTGKVIPAVMSLFSKKVNDDNEPGFNIGSLVSSLSGKGGPGSGGGVMDMLGGILGGKK